MKALSSVMLASMVALIACSEAERSVGPLEVVTSSIRPRSTMGSGTTSALLGRSAVVEGFKVKRKTGTWEIDIHSKDPSVIVTATLAIQPGGDAGWHSHPGPGFVQVTAGTARFYAAGDPSCTPTVVSAGQAWLDRGEIPHIVRNETNSTLTLLVTLLLPPGGPPRIDEPAPGNCSF